MSTQPLTYSSPWKRNLIYVYSLPEVPNHAGCLKVGMTSYDGPETAAALPPNCPTLWQAADARIRQQTTTAGLNPTLLHVELAVREKYDPKTGRKNLVTFRDKHVHKVLRNSGYNRCNFARDVHSYEWFKVDLKTVIAAIDAVKKYHTRIHTQGEEIAPRIVFRNEQEEAINRTCKRFLKDGQYDMLWDAKMRFGKTLCAFEVVNRCKYQKTLIITHRPAVLDGWSTDFEKIFPAGSGMEFLNHSMDSEGSSSQSKENAKAKEITSRLKAHTPFIYFASVQDLGGSKCIGGKFEKNDCVFNIKWDLVIIDEAHEGIEAPVGKKVKAALLKNHKTTHHLALTGTAYNIFSQYNVDSTFVWDYVMEQEAKKKWEEEHPDEDNPYGGLPRLNIYTFNLPREFEKFDHADYAVTDFEDKAFSFSEFFRTLTGDSEVDGRKLHKGEKVGDFVRPEDVDKFLDLLSKKSTTSNYPFSTDAYRDFFRHTLWIVPGVKEGAALAAKLHSHPFFKSFGIANVAGRDEDAAQYESALTQVRATIAHNKRSITISCGKLTTGVTVPEWSAVLMLAGSNKTSAASYMQTIFRVQSPGEINGARKEECYVFDFAPSRTLTVLATVAQIKVSRDQKNINTHKNKVLTNFLNYCPVIAINGTSTEPINTDKVITNLKKVFIVRAIRNGFDDMSLYSDKLMKLAELDLKKFEDLKGIVGTTRAIPLPNELIISENPIGTPDIETIQDPDRPQKEKRPLTKEEIERRKALEKKRYAISILRAISIRMPLLIYGAETLGGKKLGPNDKISLEDFVKLVDANSWAEFMPRGVTKKVFKKFIKYYDPDVFQEAGLEIRKIAERADALPPAARIREITHLFSYFKNPDKETVLTPWRVVNMHLSDTLGGWCFFDTSFNEKEPLDAPRHVLQKNITPTVFSTYSKVLEINSKSGLYPLYMAYSIYRTRLGSVREETISPRECQRLWRLTLEENLFVLCKTPMAASITRRTLMGYGDTSCVHAKAWKGDLVATLKDNLKTFTQTISRGTFWNRKDKSMTFDTIVGNPPYQLETAKKPAEHNGQARRKSIFHYFQIAADALATNYTSLIYPGGRWIHRSGKGMEEFGLEQINDPRLMRLDFFPDASEVFPAVAIADGISIVTKDMRKHSPGFDFVYHKDEKEETFPMANPGEEIIPLNPRDTSIISKVRKVMEAKNFAYLHDRILSQKLFGVESDFVEKNPKAVKPYTGQDLSEKEIKLLTNDKAGKAGRAQWFVAKRSVIPSNAALIDEWQVAVSSANAGGQKRDWQIGLIDNHSAFGRSRVGLGTFKTKAEAKNFLEYCKSYLIRFLFLQTDESLTSLAKSVPDLGDYSSKNANLDFSQDLNAQLYELFGLTKKEAEYVETTIKEVDEKRGIRPMA